jgi:ribonuclease HI
MTPPRKEVTIYTDGACEPNPGPGGYGVLLIFGSHRKEASGGFRLTTNNRMEIMAAIRGLELLNQPCRVTLYSDSQYLVNAMSLGWARRWQARGWQRNRKDHAANPDLWARLLALCARHEVEFRWVKGHAGHAENERCDELSVLALRQPELPVDEGYESAEATGPMNGSGAATLFSEEDNP